MYSKEQITFLMQNGFTVDEIMRMSAPQEQETPVPTQAPTPQEQEAPNPSPVQTPADERVDKLVGSVENLIRMIQTNNINSMQFGSPVADRTAADVLAEIINPQPKK